MPININSERDSRMLLVRNITYNFLGFALPMGVAFLSIPALVTRLGTERFGILSLAWMVVGYFTLFDMGVGRATTKYVAEYVTRRKFDELPQLIWTSLLSLLGFGLVGGIVLALLTPWLVNHALKIPIELVDETGKAFYILAVSVPFVTSSAGLRGVLEGKQKFGLVNAIKVPASIIIYAIPVVVTSFSTNLFHIVAALAISRGIFFVIYFFYCIKIIPQLRVFHLPDPGKFMNLAKFGGWLTITNTVGPFMTYMDRFIVGGLISLSAVTYYSTPYDLVTRLFIISGSIIGVLFPTLSSYAVGDRIKFNELARKSILYLLIIIGPIILISVILAQPFLNYWLGIDFAHNSSTIMQILSFGVLLCALSQVPYVAIQAMGRPDYPAKLHLIQLPLYLGIIWWLTRIFGVQGVAIAWLLRIVMDFVCLFWFYFRISETTNVVSDILMPIAYTVSGILCCLFLTEKITDLTYKCLVLSIALIIFVFYAWKIVLSDEQAAIKRVLKSLMGVSI